MSNTGTAAESPQVGATDFSHEHVTRAHESFPLAEDIIWTSDEETTNPPPLERLTTASSDGDAPDFHDSCSLGQGSEQLSLSSQFISNCWCEGAIQKIDDTVAL